MRSVLIGIVFLCLTLSASAQFTTVTGTVSDPNGVPYANGTIVSLIIASGTPVFTSNSQPYFQPTQATGLDTTGKFIVRLADNTLLSPPGSTWTFTVCSAGGTVQPAIGKGPVCFVVTGITITGASQDISAQLTAAAPALTIPIGGGGGGGLSGQTAGQVPKSNSATTANSSIPIQGTDSSLMSAGTVGGAGSLLCASGNAGATTVGCGSVPNLSVDTIAPRGAAGIVATSNFQDKAGQVVNVKAYGAICDGGIHPLSNFYPNLAAAQAVYPFITSLTQQIDYAAAKAAANVAFGPDGSEHGTNTALNIPLLFPAGTCEFLGDTLLIRKADGIKITGAGKIATNLQGTGIVLAFDGLQYSTLSDFEVSDRGGSAPITTVDIDGNVPGHPYPTFQVQGNHLDNLLIAGGDAANQTYALAFCRLGGSNGQCSENVMTNVHLSAAINPFFVFGYNALDNVWIGGDIQNFTGDGAIIQEGTATFIKTSFESTRPICTFIANNQYDIATNLGGAYETVDLVGVRTEDPQLYYGISGLYANISGVNTLPASFTWTANTAVTAGQGTYQQATDGYYRLYCATVLGSTGATIPASWPTTGTVTDGGVTWTETPYNAAVVPIGRVDMSSSNFNRLPVGGANATSPGTITLQNQLEQAGTIGPNPTTAFPFYSRDFGNSNLFEMYTAEGSQKGGVFNNAGVSASNVTGFTWPSTSAGLWFLFSSVQVGGPSAYVFFDRPNQQTVFTNNFVPQLTLSHFNANLASGINLQANGNTVIPSTATGFHGTNGIKVQFSDGTGTTGKFASYAADGSLTDSGLSFAAPGPIGATPSTGNFTGVTGVTFATATNCGPPGGVGTAANPSIVTCGAASAGAFSCDVAASAGTCQVNTTAVTADSEIFVQEVSDESARLGVTCNTSPSVLPAIVVATKSAGASFTINMPTIAGNPACFNYSIVN